VIRDLSSNKLSDPCFSNSPIPHVAFKTPSDSSSGLLNLDYKALVVENEKKGVIQRRDISVNDRITSMQNALHSPPLPHQPFTDKGIRISFALLSAQLFKTPTQVSRSYPTLESLVLDWDGGAEVDPSKVLEVVKKFKSLKRLEINGNSNWSFSDMDAISQFPLLESLKIGGFWTAETILPLINCKSLNTLNLHDKRSSIERPIYLFSFLRGIGHQLRDLTIMSRISHELISQIPELCPNLEALWIRLPKGVAPGQIVMEKLFSSEMKRMGVLLICPR
jgi:hypothetical protein